MTPDRVLVGWLILLVMVLVLRVANGSEGGLQDWIHQFHRNCCNHEDCHEINWRDVTPVEGGWNVIWRGTTHFIPESSAKPSPKGEFWLCENLVDHSIRCFGRPRMGA